MITRKRTKNRKRSRIAQAVKDYLDEYILPEYDITLIEEYRAGNGMRYDFCFPYLSEMIAIEADGVQHDKYVPFFHGNEQGFKESQYRDFHKDFNTARLSGHIIRVKDDSKKFPNVRKFLDEALKDYLYIFEEGDVKKK